MISKIICCLPFLVSLVFASVSADKNNTSFPSFRYHRELSTRKVNKCIDSSLSVGKPIQAGEAICDNGVQFGIFTYDGGTTTVYRLELRHDRGRIRLLESIVKAKNDRAPFVFLQHDGHLLFGDNRAFSRCVVIPGRDSPQNKLTLNGTNSELEITDGEGDVVWRFNPRNVASSCYPDLEDTCYTVLKKNKRISWKEYLCLYDNTGQVKYKYGLDATGLLGLWQYDELLYRPTGGWLRGDYFHFQDDGHLTLYVSLRYITSKRDKPKKYLWTSGDCIDNTATKLVITSDGDVQELNEQGAIIWTLLGSKWNTTSKGNDARDAVPEICRPGQINNA